MALAALGTTQLNARSFGRQPLVNRQARGATAGSSPSRRATHADRAGGARGSARHRRCSSPRRESATSNDRLLPIWEHATLYELRVFNRSTIVTFWKKHPDAEKALRLWFSIASKARWGGPADVRRVFGTADFLAGNRVVFDIKGNSYRLVAQIRYAPLCVVFIRFVGTHAEYDRIDAGKV